jgi:hypothetical protein
MADTLLFYAKELTTQVTGGLIFGSLLNYMFPDRGSTTTDKMLFKTVLETALQIGLTGAAAIVFIGFLQGRGWDPQSSAIGLSAFWIFLFAGQPKLQAKLTALLDYTATKAEALESDA